MKNSVRKKKSKSPASREDILRILKENRKAIRALGVRRLALFGSFARNEATRGSDLDFVVELERKSFDAYMDLKTFLETLFGCRVDLVLADAIKPRLRRPILEGAVHAPGL
jgi:predicted nucleotidyltransferase